ncbi:uncharacterized protein LOC143958065 [Lithobates pipiens]
MTIITASQTYFWSYFKTVTATVVALLFVLLGRLIDVDFKCPKNYTLAIVYSAFYIFVPWLILLFLGCKFSGVYPTLKLCCAKGGCRKIHTFVQITTASTIWIMIVLTDGDYIDCLFGTSEDKDAIVKPIAKIVGFGCICLLIGLKLFISCCICGDHGVRKWTNWRKQKYEACLVKEIEKGIRKKANKILKAEVKELIMSEYPDEKFRTDTTDASNWMKRLEEIITTAKEEALDKVAEVARKRNENSETNNTSASGGSTNGGSEGSVDGKNKSHEHFEVESESSPLLEDF